jgi:putative heme-binding domain-containing protein
VLVKATLTPDQRAALADALATVGPLELPKLLPAFERGDAPEPLGLRLVAALKASPGRASLRSEVLKPVLARFPQSVRDVAAELLKPDATAAEQAAGLDKLLAELPPGDVNRGQAAFVGKKAGCVACHATGYLGGKLGPDLTGIGKVRTDRDLLEAIVYPGASFVRGYDPVIVILKDGDKLAGIVTSEARDEIVLATGPQETRRILRTDVAEVRPGTVSLMPEGFGASLTKQEIADVIAFLRGARR